MRMAIRALTLCCAAATMGALPAAAREYPFCMVGCDFAAGRGDCSFSSYQQCQASASGRDASCAANPYFNAKDELQPYSSRRTQRKH